MWWCGPGWGIGWNDCDWWSVLRRARWTVERVGVEGAGSREIPGGGVARKVCLGDGDAAAAEVEVDRQRDRVVPPPNDWPSWITPLCDCSSAIATDDVATSIRRCCRETVGSGIAMAPWRPIRWVPGARGNVGPAYRPPVTETQNASADAS